jgi:hypothetical protein
MQNILFLNNQTTVKLNHLFIISMTFLICCCSPNVEDISYSVNYKDKNNLNKDSTAHIDVIVNTKKDLFKGRETFFSFKKEYYFIKLSSIDTLYSEKDISIGIFSSIDTSINPKYGRIKINSLGKPNITLYIDIKDSFIPQQINGRYKLKEKERNADYIWYKY